MRILILTPRLPWPPEDGGRLAMARLAESLAAAGAEVAILSLNPRKHRGVATGPLPIEAIDIDTSRRLAPVLRALSGRMPYVAARFVSADFRDAVQSTVRRFAPDIVQIESPFLLPYVNSVRSMSGARVVLRSLNAEFRIWEGLATRERARLRRLALGHVAATLRRFERTWMAKVDAIVPISESDAADFRALGVTRPMHVVPCGVKLQPATTEASTPATVGFIGSLDFLPNQDAVRWIVEEIWPRISSDLPSARLAIAGSSAPPWVERLTRECGADFAGRVADPAAFLRSKAVVIAPLLAGSGMRIKVLEAMALGKPVVSTTIGAAGIDVENGADIVVADDADAFARAVVRLLHHPEAAAKIGAAARAKVASRYDSDALGRGLFRFYQSLQASSA